MRAKGIETGTFSCGLKFAVIFLFLSQARLQASLIPTDARLFTSVSDNVHETQSNTILGPPSMPFVTSHTATLGPSTSHASYAFQLGSNFVDYLINIQHTCVQAAAEHTDCRSSGTIDFTPRADVLIEIDGAYHYNMTTDSMLSGASANVRRINATPPSTILFGDGGSAITIFNPGTGTIPLLASGTVPAGFHYRLVYTTQIRFNRGQPTTSTANGFIHFRVTEVPEPAALGPLGFAVLLIRKRRTRQHAS